MARHRAAGPLVQDVRALSEPHSRQTAASQWLDHVGLGSAALTLVGTGREIGRGATVPADGDRHVLQVGSPVAAPVHRHRINCRRVPVRETVPRPAITAMRDRKRADATGLPCLSRVRDCREACVRLGQWQAPRARQGNLAGRQTGHFDQHNDASKQSEQEPNGWSLHQYAVVGLRLRMHRQLLLVTCPVNDCRPNVLSRGCRSSEPHPREPPPPAP
jgi:hypothetical protein